MCQQKKDNINSTKDSNSEIKKSLNSFGDYRNAIVAGEKNFMDIVDNFSNVSKNTLYAIDDYLAEASKVNEEILKCMNQDIYARAEAQRAYDTVYNNYPKTKTEIVNGVPKTVSAEEDAKKAAQAAYDSKWKRLRSWPWDH